MAVVREAQSKFEHTIEIKSSPKSSFSMPYFEGSPVPLDDWELEDFSVWIVARPLDLPDYISFISRGRLPFCHWGVLVSSIGRWDIESEWFEMEMTEPNSRHTLSRSWGSLYELYRDPASDKNRPNVITGFGPSAVVDEWAHSVAHYVGQTTATSAQICLAGVTPYFNPLTRSNGNY